MNWLIVTEAAEASRRHPVTIRKALEAGELHGEQRKKGGRWSISSDCLNAWVANKPCEHKATNVVQLQTSGAALSA